jgi:hypothetical protein
VSPEQSVGVEAAPALIDKAANTELSCEAPNAGFVCFNFLFDDAVPPPEYGHVCQTRTLPQAIR